MHGLMECVCVGSWVDSCELWGRSVLPYNLWLSFCTPSFLPDDNNNNNTIPDDAAVEAGALLPSTRL